MTQNWEINVNFKVSGKGKELYGDGFAIWYARDRLVPGPVFGSKDYFMGLAIILDTYSNHNGPHNVRRDKSFYSNDKVFQLMYYVFHPVHIIASTSIHKRDD